MQDILPEPSLMLATGSSILAVPSIVSLGWLYTSRRFHILNLYVSPSIIHIPDNPVKALFLVSSEQLRKSVPNAIRQAKIYVSLFIDYSFSPLQLSQGGE